MSGIAGYYGIDDPNGPAAHELLERMNRFQAHRGPDEEGFFQEGPCGMGHRRLVILDEQGGSQPMFSANGRFVLSFNGMVFNYQQLRHELAGLGHQFKTAADAEVVLAAWVEWGTECLDRFNGMWGMAVYDRLEQRLTLSRDHLGIKPLYYAPLGSQPGSASQEDTGGVTAPSANAAAASANAAAP
ncbi:MAG: hypothetical protein FWF71_07200, partial [Actinomycetia bacterium]|nr:hypothetical protein [Actinomycetes bacterium]